MPTQSDAAPKDYPILRVVSVCALAAGCRYAWLSELRDGEMVPVAGHGGTFPVEPLDRGISGPHVGRNGAPLTISVGVSTADGPEAFDRLSFADLLQRADQALYTAKHDSRNRVHVWTPASDTRSGATRPR